MFSSGTTTRSCFKWLAIGILILGGVLTLPFNSLANVDDPEPVAQIFAVLWGDEEVPQVSSDLVTITRGPGGCAPTGPFIKKGVPLCKLDMVKTAKNVKVKIVFGDPKNRNEYTLEERSEVKISSIWCGRLCHWFASLTGKYDNRVQHVGLTNKSTVYEVKAHADESVEVMVFEGEVDITKPPPDTAAEPGSGAPAEASPSPANNVLDTVPHMYRAIINADGTIAEKRRMTREQLCSALAFSTGAEILLHQSPPEAGGHVAKFTYFPNSGRRNTTFDEARCSSFWEPSQGQHLETLGYVYTDWGDAEKALELFDKAAKLYAAVPGWAGPSDQLRINKAMALRQLAVNNEKLYEDGLKELEPVLVKTDSALTGRALNVRGSIFYDQARHELLYNRTDDGLAKAKQLLAKASADYDKAVTQAAGNDRQYIEVNQGQVLKAEGDFAQREGDYTRAETKYIEAIKKMMDAYGHEGDNPKNKVASLFVARARAALANTYAAMGKPAQSEEFYTKAENTYKGVIEDAKNAAQTFAGPYCGLGSLYLILGREGAAENYAACIAFSTSALVTDVPVPNVTGLRRAVAIHILAEAGLQPEIVEDGEIVETQEPAVPSVVKVGTKIKIKLPKRDRS